MKKLPAALAFSASALVVSLGWFSLQTTESSSLIELPASPPISVSEFPAATGRADSALEGSIPPATSREDGVRAESNRVSHTSPRYPRSFTSPRFAQSEDSPRVKPSVPEVHDRMKPPSLYPQTLPYAVFPPPQERPAVTIQGFAGSGYLNVKLAPGARLPVVVAEDDEGTSLPMSEAKEEIAEEFEEEILKTAAKGPDDIGKTWAQAQERADRRFRQLYGKDAYNRASLKEGQVSLRAGQKR